MNNQTAPARILLVEDEALVAMFIEDLLIELGFEVIGPAANVKNAIDLCREEQIDGALLDVNLGGGQRSDPVAAYLASNDIPFAFITGYGEAGMREQFADRPILQKPFELAELRQLIARCLA